MQLINAQTLKHQVLLSEKHVSEETKKSSFNFKKQVSNEAFTGGIVQWK